MNLTESTVIYLMRLLMTLKLDKETAMTLTIEIDRNYQKVNEVIKHLENLILNKKAFKMREFLKIL